MKKMIMIALIAVITGIMVMGCEKEKSLCEKSIPTTYSIREFVSINQLCEEIKSNLSCSILGYPQSIGGFKRTTVGLSLKSKAFRKFVVFWPVKRTISHHISAGMDFEGGMYNGSDYGSSFGFSRENILVAKTIDVQPYRNPEYGVHSAYGYVRIPAVKAEYNYPN